MIPLKCNCQDDEDRLLRTGLGLELLDHAVQSVLMWRGYRQKLEADTGGPGPADCGILDQDRLGVTRNMQFHRELHACKGTDDAVYAASSGGKVAHRSRMPELILVQ